MPDPSGAGEVLELRVHGVSGTTPQDLLDRPLVEQVAGDRIAGFYRPRLLEERTDDAPNPFAPAQPGAPELTSYNWGGLTSGSRGRALWLILLPLTLANVAPRARPAGPAATSLGVRILWYLSRVLALSLTCLYVVTGIGVGGDLVAWQCSGGDACANASPDFVFHDLGYRHRLSAEHMLLVGVCVPVVLLLVLWFVSARTANRYERTVVDQTPYRLASRRGPAPAETPLSSPDMWRNAAPVRRLRAVHLQTGFALVLWSVIAVSEGPREHWYDLSGHWWTLAPLAVLGHTLVVLAVPSFTGHEEHALWRRTSVAIWTLLAIAGTVQVVGLAFAHRWVDDAFLTSVGPAGRPGEPGGGDVVARTPFGALPYYSPTVLVVCAAAVGLLVLVVGVALALRVDELRHPSSRSTGDHRPVRAPLCGLASAAFAALAVFLAAAFSAGTYMFVATWLDTGSVRPGYRSVAHIYDRFTVPPVIATANIAYALAVGALATIVVVGAVVAVVRIAWFPGSTAQLAADHPGYADTVPVGEVASRARQIRRALFIGRIVDHASWFVAAMVVSGGLLVAYFSIGLLLDHARAPEDVFGGPVDGWRSAASLGATGTYLAVFTVIGLVVLGSLAFRVPATRRTVGILWDVAAFWPRLCHPLAPPCYAERTVPDLVTFITDHRVRHPDRGVVLAAHSQGTVIGAAVVRQLATYDAHRRPDTMPVDVVPRLAFLTFGCVLRRLYGRFFPAWFGPAELYELETILGGTDEPAPRWINLWRHTDYLGGQVTDGPPQTVPAVSTPPDPTVLPTAPATTGPVGWEWHSPDPPAFTRRPGDTTYPVPGRHSDFWSDESGYFQLAAARLADTVRHTPPTRPADAGPAVRTRP